MKPFSLVQQRAEVASATRSADFPGDDSVGFGTCNCLHPILEPGGPCAGKAGAAVYLERSVLLAGIAELQGMPYMTPAGVLKVREIFAEAERAGKAAAESQGSQGKSLGGFGE